MVGELEGGQLTLVAATQSVQRLKEMIHRPKTAVSIEEMNIAVALRSRRHLVGAEGLNCKASKNPAIGETAKAASHPLYWVEKYAKLRLSNV